MPAPAQVPRRMQGKGLCVGFAVPGQRLARAVTPSSLVFELRLRSCFSRELRAGLQWSDVTGGWLPEVACVRGIYLL